MTPTVSRRKPPEPTKPTASAQPIYGQSHRRASAQRRPLRAAHRGVEQHPNWRRVLQDDGRGHVRPLNCEVIEIVRHRDPQNSKQKELQQVASGTRNADAPLRASSTGNSTASDKVARLCDRISGSIFPSDAPPGSRCPVNAARPSVAEIPQRNAALPI